MAEEVVAEYVGVLQVPQEGDVRGRHGGFERIAGVAPGLGSRPPGRGRHAVGGHGLAAAEFAPRLAPFGVAEEVEHGLVVVALEEVGLERPEVGELDQGLQHLPRAGPAVDVVAQAHQHHARAIQTAVLVQHPLQQGHEQIGPAVDVAYGVGDDAGRNRRRGRLAGAAEHAAEGSGSKHGQTIISWAEARLSRLRVRERRPPRRNARRSGSCRRAPPGWCWSADTRAHRSLPGA